MSLRVKFMFFMSENFVFTQGRQPNLVPAPGRFMHLKINLIVGLALIVGLIGCATSRPDIAKSDLPPGDMPSFHSLAASGNVLQEPLEIKEPTGSITLREAIALALVKNPELAAFSWEIRARKARMLQAGLLPNPELQVELQDIAGSGVYRGTRSAESTIQLSQLIELGGKRSRRVRGKKFEKDLADWDYRAKKIDILTLATHAFIEVLSAQQQLVLAEKSVRLAEEIVHTVSGRVRAGKVLPVEETRANVSLFSVQIEVEQARQRLDSARKGLTSAWGSTNPKFERAEGDLSAVSPVPLFDPLISSLSQNPDIARLDTETALGQAMVDLEKSRAFPDITVSAGYRRFNASDDNAIVVGASIPLPLFNKNQGGKQEALHRLAKIEKERHFVQTRLRTALAKAYNRLSVAYFKTHTLKTKIIPGAQTAFDITNQGYRLGKFRYLNVLDTQRTLFDAQVEYIQALTEYHKAVADVERLIGGSMSDIR